MESLNIDTHAVPDDCMLSVRDALDVLGGKWKLPILLCLRHGNKRFRELQKLVPGITAKMLSQALRELEQNRIIQRIGHEDSRQVEYRVTHYYKSVEKMIEALKEWGDHHRALIFNKQGCRDTSSGSDSSR